MTVHIANNSNESIQEN